MMNIFRLVGDALHILAIVMLPYKLLKTRSASGVSLKTQELYLLVFLTRYMDLFYRFISTYNTTMKIIYICLTGMSILMIRQQPSLKASYEANLDYFRHWRFAVFPSIAITVLLNVFKEQPRYISFSGQVLGELWQFSQVLEPIAMVPQLLLLRQSTDFRKVGWVYRYVAFMVAYRGMYMLNWVFRAYNEFGYRHYPILYIGSIVQVSLILIFFVEHVTRVDEPLHVLSDEVDIMDSNSFARERLLHRGMGYASDPASPDGVGMESPPRPQSHDGFRFGHDSALTVGGGGAATESSEAGYGVDGVYIV